MTKTLINGSKGRMGQALLRCGAAMEGIEVVGGLDLGDCLADALGGADVVIDFTLKDATLDVVSACAAAGVPVVIGTTGHEDAERAGIVDAGKSIPMVWATNFSTGVNTLFWLTQQAARILDSGFDREVIEMHHRHKQDAPSGTARTLVEVLAEEMGVPYGEATRHGREGMVGARTVQEIGVHSLRGGDVVGDHTVVFAADGERVELTHKASSRDTFANGALRAARWVVGKEPGLYDMRDVLGLS